MERETEQKFIEAYMAATSGWRDFTHLSGIELIEGIVAELNQRAIEEADRLMVDPCPPGPLKIDSIKLSMFKLLEQLPVFQDVDLEDVTSVKNYMNPLIWRKT